MKIIDNFIDDPKIFTALQEILLSDKFSWFYSEGVANNKDNSVYYFFHRLFEDNYLSNAFDLCHPLIGRLQFNKLLRAKINCYTKKEKQIQHNFHTDFTKPHKVALYSVNTNNGYTLFETGEKIDSVANRCVIFDGKHKHCSVTQNDVNLRINININFI